MDVIIIYFLGKYVVNEKQKIVGVVCLLMEMIVINVGKSICIVCCFIVKLEELGIIKCVVIKERYRCGGYSVNLYVFFIFVIDCMDDCMKMFVCESEDYIVGCSGKE